MKNIFGIIILSLTIFGCKKIELNNLAFPREELSEYQLEDYDGEVEVPDSFLIDESKIHLFTLPSFSSETDETYEIYALYIGDLASIPTDSIILYAHGQSKHMDNYWSRAKLLANIGSKNNYGVLMMDYRGYGMSEGLPSEIGLYEDVEVCINWLKDNGAQPSKTFYYGYSLGAIPVIEHAAYKTDFVPSKLMIESPLASVEYLTQSSTLINVDSKFVTTLEFDNAEKMKDVKMPLLWFHGVEDDYISMDNGELIYQNHSGSYKEAHRIEGSNHSEIPEKMGFENYLKVLHEFITK
ncbi:MAG: alpha/beta hydrolase [Putridiphycobacter sp.]